MNDTIAIVSNRITTGGGSEQVAFDMSRALDAPIFVPFYDDDVIPDDIDIRGVFPRWTHRIIERWGIVGEAIAMLEWPRVDVLDGYDTVIVNMPRAGWWVPIPHQRVFMYSHGTQHFTYGAARRGGSWVKQMMYTAASTAYDTTHHKYDGIATNSSWTLKQISLYHDVDESICSVIHPTASVSTDIDGGEGDRYISMSRIDRGKRIDDIVTVMNELKLPTTVAGTGPNLPGVKAMADEHIEFPGWVSGRAKRNLLRSAKAMIITCRRESFGISALEAITAGVPLIAIKGSAVDEMIKPGKNGYICEQDRLAATIRRFESDGVEWGPSQIRADAENRYSPDGFAASIRTFVDD